ncbi:hypothetical protein WICPIJ_003137 [Wickerhamomyces pijperi]|uniref:Uncharacterized protein n=1 Tax=Wickerhamomyces pijperi TaxID=599730 RepID=A0A9P8Q7N6_WICPI|nr:hypothetical protein WICPIJ_003137 [Wickerhamomyces pijperi]
MRIITLSNKSKASTCFISIFLSMDSIRFKASSNRPREVNILASCNNHKAEFGNEALANNKAASSFLPGCNKVGSPVPWKALVSDCMILADLTLESGEFVSGFGFRLRLTVVAFRFLVLEPHSYSKPGGKCPDVFNAIDSFLDRSRDESDSAFDRISLAIFITSGSNPNVASRNLITPRANTLIAESESSSIRCNPS